MEIIPADRFSLEDLTDAYNQTRVDYLVPMPMNVAKMREYTNLYDIHLSHSCVAVSEDLMLGLGMLGVRSDRCWITRLGVLPYGRRMGTGGAIMKGLLAQADKLKLRHIWLEVIKGNTPAHTMFRKFGFQETRELIVARRPPKEQITEIPETVQTIKTLGHADALALLELRQNRPNWLNETETMRNMRNLSALVVQLRDGGWGWVTYHASLLQLTRIVVEVVTGDPQKVTAAILGVLHQRHKRQDAIAENLPEDEQWLGFQEIGYFDSFRRVEMVKELS